MYFQILEFYLSIVPKKKKGPIHCLARTFKKHKDINSTLEMNANIGFTKMYPKIWYYFQNFIFFCMFYLETPIFLIVELLFGQFYHAFKDIFYFFVISSIFIFYSSCIFVFVCEWWRKFLFFLLGIWSWKTQKLQVSCVYAHLWWPNFLKFNLRKEANIRRIMIPRKWMKAYEGLKSWSSIPTFWP